MQESISFGKPLRKAIRQTVKILARAVKGTLGPQGTNVGVRSELHLPVIINDGVTVAKKITLVDPLKNYILGVLKTIPQNTELLGGDGTSTSITLAEAIILEALKNIEAGFSQVDVVKGIKVATAIAIKELDLQASPVLEDRDRLIQVATISANNDPELGEIIAEVFTKVGVDGKIEMKTSTDNTTYVDVVQGAKYNSGYESSMFSTDQNQRAILEDTKILIYEGKLQTIDPIIELLKETRNQNTSLLIVADEFDPQAVNDLANNKIQYKLKVCAVRSPGYGSTKEKALDDLAFITGAEIISNRFGRKLDQWEAYKLGDASSVKVDDNSFTVIAEATTKEQIDERVAELKKDLKEDISKTEKEEILNRIARLAEGVAVLFVGGDSPVEVSEKKYRIEDAINASRASLEEGILPGGGVALLKIGEALNNPGLENQSQDIGFNILKKALRAPAVTIANNAGDNGDVVVSNILRGDSLNYGYDARLKQYGDLLELGVLDPKKVTKIALINASSVSQMLLTMNCAIY